MTVIQSRFRGWKRGIVIGLLLVLTNLLIKELISVMVRGYYLRSKRIFTTMDLVYLTDVKFVSFTVVDVLTLIPFYYVLR